MKVTYAPGLVLVLSIRAALCSTRNSHLALHLQRPSLSGIASSRQERRSSGPSSLEAYCAQVDPDDKNWNADSGYVVGQPVMADWLEFGVLYKAHVTGINRDGTYNVEYDDTMSERSVKPGAMKPRKTGPKNIDPSKDPACSIKDDVEDLDRNIDEAIEEIARWTSERHKKRREGEKETSTPAASTSQSSAAPAPSQSAAPAPAEAAPASPAGAAGGPAGAGGVVGGPAAAPAPSKRKKSSGGRDENGLKNVIDCVFDVDDELEIIEAKKVELVEAGKMDPELEEAIDGAVERHDRVKDNVKALQEAIATEREANKELENAQEGSRAAAEGNGPVHPDAHEDVQVREEEAREVMLRADEKVEKRVSDLQLGLREVKQSTHKFNTNVTPNKGKWWRYRYEYSFVESLILLCIVPLMVIYKFIFSRMREYERKAAKTSSFRSISKAAKTMHLDWLEFAAGEMFVCFCVVLTIWVAATFGCLDFLVMHVRDDNMHLPTLPEQYRVIAVNIAMQLGLALIAYHALVYSVVRATVNKFLQWGSYEGFDGSNSHRGSASTSMTPSMLARAPTLMGDQHNFAVMRSYFLDALEKYPNIKQKLEDIEPLSDFPFGRYLSVNVRIYTDHILELTSEIWLSVWLTLFVFMLLHRFAHMAYVRIMGFFVVALVIVVAGMLLTVQRVVARMEEWNMKSDEEQEAEFKKTEEFQKRFILSKEQWVSHILQFTVFFLCYGFVRMATAPWLWHIYFYRVLLLSCIFLLVMLFFVFYLAPLIPVFYAAMSIPPNISEDDADVIVKTLKDRRKIEEATGMRKGSASFWWASPEEDEH